MSAPPTPQQGTDLQRFPDAGTAVTGVGQNGIKGTALGGGIGVFGYSIATAGNAIGVQCLVRDGTTGAAVRGIHENTGPLGYGIWGSHAGGGPGVYGTTVTGVGVLGEGSVYGVRGVGTAAGTDASIGIEGIAHTTQGVGVKAYNSHPDGVAALFNVGNVGGGSGNIIIGQSNGLTRFRVDATGRGYFNNGTQVGGADFAESVEAQGSRDDYEPGDVLVIDLEGRRRVAKTAIPYSTTVAGIYSTQPGVLANPYGIDDARLASGAAARCGGHRSLQGQRGKWRDSSW
jgi:hypothetical protein